MFVYLLLICNNDSNKHMSNCFHSNGCYGFYGKVGPLVLFVVESELLNRSRTGMKDHTLNFHASYITYPKCEFALFIL